MRVGEICLSPDMAFPVLFPVHASGYTFRNEIMPPPADPITPDLVLAAMDVERASSQLRAADDYFAQFLQTCLPAPVERALSRPIHLIAWRVETPGRTCLYTGQHPAGDHPIVVGQDFAPHMLSKALLDDRSHRPDPSAIHLVSDRDALIPSPDHIRASLLHYAQTALTAHHEKIRAHPNPVLDTTLDEVFACLVHAPARNHTSIALNQSPPWDKDHIDSRCVPLHARAWLES